MSKERLYIFDTTLRDGAQTQGVHFSIDEKTKIAPFEENFPGYKPDKKVYINKEGKEVYTTCVSNTLEHGCHFDDMVYLGEVQKYSHSV